MRTEITRDYARTDAEPRMRPSLTVESLSPAPVYDPEPCRLASPCGKCLDCRRERAEREAERPLQ